MLVGMVLELMCYSDSIEWRNELSCDHFPLIQAFKEVTTNLGLCHSMGLHQDWKSWDFGCNSRHFHFRSLSKDWPKPLFWKSHSAHLPGYTAVRDCELITKQTASRLAIGPSNVLSAWAETLVLHVICSLPFGLCLIKLRPSSGAFPSCCWSHPVSLCSLTGVTQPLTGASLHVGHWNFSPLPVHPQLPWLVTWAAASWGSSLFIQWSLFHLWVPQMLFLVCWTFPGHPTLPYPWCSHILFCRDLPTYSS